MDVIRQKNRTTMLIIKIILQANNIRVQRDNIKFMGSKMAVWLLQANAPCKCV
uniref:Uncharacterized protein n=1 Tax=Arundo donax TaxID=35708 RepID=A0A0A9BL13_ARUDO